VKKSGEIRVWLQGLAIDTLTQSPVLILRDEAGEVAIPIWIGIAEATSIASALKEIPSFRPLSHDLIKSLLMCLSATLESVAIVKLEEGTFFAEARVRAKDGTLYVLDSRPSDAIALAVRFNSPIFVAEEVARSSFVRIETTGSQAEQGEKEAREGEKKIDLQVESLQHLDKEKWKEILEKLNPEDFKHKH
jgi:bifunctional DNase/RNase